MRARCRGLGSAGAMRAGPMPTVVLIRPGVRLVVRPLGCCRGDGMPVSSATREALHRAPGNRWRAASRGAEVPAFGARREALHRVLGSCWRAAASDAADTPRAEQPGPAMDQQPHQQPPLPWYICWRPALVAAVGLPAVGGFSYWVLNSPMFGPAEVNIDIKPITEEVFEAHDNLFVLFLDASTDLVQKTDIIQHTIRRLMAEKSLHRVRYFYNVKKEGDPPVPDPGKDSAQEDKDVKAPLPVVMYKGQRKGFLNFDTEVPVQEVLGFFELLSEDLPAEAKQQEVPRVSGQSFPQDVVAASKPAMPVLLQMYEDTCFLCFLMRPFVNSLAKLLKTHNVPIVFKRLNIEKNDFPDGCPVARSTPTFILFRGPGVPPDTWEEFKPKDLVEKLTKVFAKHTEDIFDQMDELQGMVSKRFQLFTQLVMWTTELHKLERLITEAPLGKAMAGALPTAGDLASVEGQEGSLKEDVAFNVIVSEMMARDMKRLDDIFENLSHLQKEVDEVEHDALLMGTMLADAVRRREEAEEEYWNKKPCC